jgi:hypothetical protein
LAAVAVEACAAGGHERQHDVVAGLQRGDAIADLFDDPGALVAEHDRGRQGDGAVLHGEVRVADARGDDLHLRLARPGRGDLDVVVHVQVLAKGVQHRSRDHSGPRVIDVGCR